MSRNVKQKCSEVEDWKAKVMQERLLLKQQQNSLI